MTRLRVWDVETNTLINEFRAEPTALKYVSVSPDESRAIFQYYDQVAVLWDLKQNRQLRLWADYGGTGWSSKLSPDGKSLVEVRQTLIKIWDVPSGTLRHVVFEGTQNYRQTLAISPDSRRFAVRAGLVRHGSQGYIIPEVYRRIFPMLGDWVRLRSVTVETVLRQAIIG